MLHTDLGIDRNELVRRLKQNIQNGHQDGYPIVMPLSPPCGPETYCFFLVTNGVTSSLTRWHDNNPANRYSSSITLHNTEKTLQPTPPVRRLLRRGNHQNSPPSPIPAPVLTNTPGKPHSLADHASTPAWLRPHVLAYPLLCIEADSIVLKSACPTHRWRIRRCIHTNV